MRLRPDTSRQLVRLLMVVVAALSAGAVIAAYGTHLFATLDGTTIDTRFAIRGREAPPKNVVVVGIDDRTFDALNLQWPFPRRVDARAISRISRDLPAAIAFDVMLSESSLRGRADDVALLQAIDAAHGRTAFAFTATDGRGGVSFLGSGEGTKLLHEVGSAPADARFPLDAGGIIRRIDATHDGLPTLALVTARLATRRPLAAWRGHRYIDFAGAAKAIPEVPFSEVVSGAVPPGYFRGKVVVIGALDPSLQDLHPTATDSAMPGPVLQANAIATVLRGFPLGTLPGWVTILLIVLLASAPPLLALRLRPAKATAAAAATGLLFALAVQIAFDAGLVVSFVYPVAALSFGAVGALAVQVLAQAVERLRVRDLFARFVPEGVVDALLADRASLRLGGVQRETTVMFTDLRGFTSFSEALPPARVLEVLNRYLSEMSDAILDQQGTLISYIGDGIMAVFGAPLEQADHADRALATAREMLEVRLPRVNAWLAAQGLEVRFRMGIGLNTGPVMAGQVGSERRVEYTAIGDTTNSASRIESLTKDTPHQLLLADSTRRALVHPPPDLMFVKECEIRGRVGRVRLWTVPERDAPPLQPAPAPAETAPVG